MVSARRTVRVVELGTFWAMRRAARPHQDGLVEVSRNALTSGASAIRF